MTATVKSVIHQIAWIARAALGASNTTSGLSTWRKLSGRAEPVLDDATLGRPDDRDAERGEHHVGGREEAASARPDAVALHDERVQRKQCRRVEGREPRVRTERRVAQPPHAARGARAGAGEQPSGGRRGSPDCRRGADCDREEHARDPRA